MLNATTILLTGLSGSGKSTLGFCTAAELSGQHSRVQILDADSVLSGLGSDLGYSIADRFENIRRLTYIAKVLAQNGVTVLVAAICPLREMRTWFGLRFPT